MSNRPVFFIHPCQTTEVMEASVGKRDVTAAEYLLIWIGAMGKCVGLDIPLALMRQDHSASPLVPISQKGC
jgi:ubiquitin-like-conjugating enzyme ATG10